MKKYNIFKKQKGGKEVLVEVLLIVIALSMVMLFKTQIIGMATNVFEYCENFISSNFSTVEQPEGLNEQI
ncbi:MAG: hypothetical protein ACI4GD_03695 [Lachnospiraceae bacterium]